MAHIFKHPDGSSKGIVVFTHKEMGYFYRDHAFFQPYRSRKERLKKLVLPENNKEAKEDRQILKRIHNRYFIGTHFGWGMERFPKLEHIDFTLSSPTGVTFEEGSTHRQIPLNSSNFTPAHFYLPEPKKHLKMWDILMVSRDTRFKNLDKFLHSIRKLFDSGNVCDVLLVVPSNKRFDTDETKVYTALLEDYQRMFSADERDRFSIIKMHPDLPHPGVSPHQIRRFFHLSKVFTLFSKKEGGSKVISEALLSGLPVVVKSDLEGGGRDSLNEKNSVFFDDFNSAHLALAKALDQWEELNADPSAMLYELHEEHVLKRLEKEFEQLFDAHGQTYTGNLINTNRLGKRLPAHWHDGLPWADLRFASPDIGSQEQLGLFTKTLNL